MKKLVIAVIIIIVIILFYFRNYEKIEYVKKYNKKYNNNTLEYSDEIPFKTYRALLGTWTLQNGEIVKIKLENPSTLNINGKLITPTCKIYGLGKKLEVMGDGPEKYILENSELKIMNNERHVNI